MALPRGDGNTDHCGVGRMHGRKQQLDEVVSQAKPRAALTSRDALTPMPPEVASDRVSPISVHWQRCFTAASFPPVMTGWMGCLLGIVIGCGGCLVWQRYEQPDSELVAARQQIVTLTRERAEAARKCVEVKDHLAALAVTSRDLNRRLGGLPPPSVPPLSSGSGPSTELIHPPALDQTMTRAFRERQLREETERLTRRLLLTATQSQQLERVLADSLETAGDTPFFGLAGAPWFKDALEKLLTPEQKANYETLLKHDEQSQAEMSARFELHQLERAVELTDAQRQALLPILMDRARTVIGSGSLAAEEDGIAPDPLAHMQARIDRSIEAVAGILTASQLEGYRKHLMTQLEGAAAMLKAQRHDVAPPQAGPSQ
jgi:hypothetical protein